MKTKTSETRGHGKEKTMETFEKTQVLARAHRSHWFESERGGYTTVKSFFYLDTPKEDERMKKDLGAFADGFADIRVAFQSSKRSDGTPIRYATVLAAPHQVEKVLQLLDAFWLGFNCGKHAK